MRRLKSFSRSSVKRSSSGKAPRCRPISSRPRRNTRRCSAPRDASAVPLVPISEARSDAMKTANRTNRITCVALACVALAAMLAITSGCGDDSPGGPTANEVERLAGGGRAKDDDVFIGGRGDSGPVTPIGEGGDIGMPDFVGGLIPIFYSDRNCFDAPFERVITSQEELDAWWETAY